MRRAAALLACALAAAPAAAEELAGRCGERSIALAELDARAAAKTGALRDQLRERLRAAIRGVVDARLDPAGEPPAGAPVSSAEIEAFRAAHREDFEGPAAPGGSARDADVQRDAIRFYLERERRAEALHGAREARLSQHALELALPERLDRALAPERVLARLDGEPIRAGEVERRGALALYRLRGELYRERMRQLGSWLDACLLERVAARAGVAPDALERSWREQARASDADLAAFVASQRAAGRGGVTPERARPYLEFQRAHALRESALAGERARTRVEVLLEEPVPPRFEVESPPGAPALGAAQGPTLVAFTNYRCRWCRATHAELDALLERERGLRIVFRDFVPGWDPAARDAAALARCAARQGAFAGMRRELLRREPPQPGRAWFAPPELEALAHGLSIDVAALRRCLGDASLREAIARDTEAAQALGFDAAPAFVAAGTPLSGMQSAQGLARALQAGAGEQAAPAR